MTSPLHYLGILIGGVLLMVALGCNGVLGASYDDGDADSDSDGDGDVDANGEEEGEGEGEGEGDGAADSAADSVDSNDIDTDEVEADSEVFDALSDSASLDGEITHTTPTSYEWGALNVGELVYIDRSYTFLDVPAEMTGLPYLRTSNEDKDSSDSGHISFEIDRAATVYVAHDTRISTKPIWLDLFTQTDLYLESSDARLNLRSRVFSAGTVTLGGNVIEGWANNNSMYVVVVAFSDEPADGDADADGDVDADGDADADGDVDADADGDYPWIEGAPYPSSSVVEAIDWDWDTWTPRDESPAPGSDQWPVTWASDGHLYLAWGDGGGFGGTNDLGRVSMGVARIEGSPDRGFETFNIWGGVDPESSQDAELGKARIVEVDGVLYLFGEEQNEWMRTRVIRSDDFGSTWSAGEFIFEYPINRFNPIQFGPGYSGARDEFVYGYFNGSEYNLEPDEQIFLARVPRTDIEDRNEYEIFSGFDGEEPTWSYEIDDRVAVFRDGQGANWGFQSVYHPLLDRYLLTISHGGGEGDMDGMGPGLGIFDAEEPWGPFTTVYYIDQWGNIDDKFCFSFPQKWLDETAFWMIHSGWPEYDGYYHIRGEFILR